MSKRLLIIEDDPDIRAIYKEVFEGEGYQIEASIDGINVLNNRFIIPDVILLDRWLGLVDGLSVCRHLKANKATQHIPVVLVSASLHVRRAAQEAGAEAALDKPIDLDELINVVNHWANHNNDQALSNSMM